MVVEEHLPFVNVTAFIAEKRHVDSSIAKRGLERLLQNVIFIPSLLSKPCHAARSRTTVQTDFGCLE